MARPARTFTRGGLGATVLLALALATVAPPAALGASAESGESAIPASSGPRPLTEAERQSVQLAAAYLADGPAAWWPALASGSWLRALGREAALAEIEARAGTAAGSTWTLQATPADFAAQGAAFTLEFPSGADDTLLITLVEEGGAWKIDSLRVAGEPGAGAGRGAVAGSLDESARWTPGGNGATGWRGTSGLLGRHLVLAVLAAVCLALAGLVTLVIGGTLLARRPKPPKPAAAAGGSFVMVRREPRRGLLALCGAGVALLALAFLLVVTALRQRGASATALAEGSLAAAGAAGQHAPEHVALRALLPLRHALTAAAAPSAVAAAVTDAARAEDALRDAAAPAGSDAASREVGRLWLAQYRIDRGDLSGGERLLTVLPVPAAEPLAELLRARLALLRLQQMETGLAYHRALVAGVAHEGLLLEASQAFYILGFEDTAKRFLHELEALGARTGEPYYVLADLALLDNRSLEAHKNFRLAWRLTPVSRAELLAQSLSAYMLQDRELLRMMALGTFGEPVGACGEMSRRPLALSRGMRPRLLGEQLRIMAAGGGGHGGEAGAAGSAELRVPGACDLAPAGTTQDSARSWQEEREMEALARLPALRQMAAFAGTLAQPVLRRQTEEAAAALAERQRWTDLIEITEELAQPAAILPGQLTQLRAVALARTGRKPEARQLLVRLALGDKVTKRADPGMLYYLARLLEEEGEFDQAIKLVAKANSALPSPPGGDRILQLQMEKRLASSMDRFKSPHFLVSFPAGRGQAFAKEAARILEAERQRLQQWIPVGAATAPIEVRLLPYEDFELGYSQGGEVAGLYTGVIRVPLGNLRTFVPDAVAIMSHELAHALIAQATGDHAPHWFHEGLAQHIEMHEEGRANPIADYRGSDRLLAFPLLEPAIESFSSAVWVTAGYDEALWAVNYIEARYGLAGIHRLLEAFRAGRTTDEALAGALGVSVERFDHDAWEWCVQKAPRAWALEVVRYDGGEAKPKRF
jgi:tetratricopeptide (TPR) repeat protein